MPVMEPKPYSSLMMVAEGLPALGIVAAVLGVIKAMGALDQSSRLLGSLIGAALVGTFAGNFLSYGLVAPLAQKIKMVREQRLRLYVIVKQTLLAFMNGALPQIAIEHGRKMIGPGERPSIDVVETETISGATALKVSACRSSVFWLTISTSSRSFAPRRASHGAAWPPCSLAPARGVPTGGYIGGSTAGRLRQIDAPGRKGLAAGHSRRARQVTRRRHLIWRYK